jgi:hypothetical protein
MSVRNYHYTLRNMAEERIFQCTYWFHMIAAINIHYFPIQLQETDLFCRDRLCLYNVGTVVIYNLDEISIRSYRNHGTDFRSQMDLPVTYY